MGETWSLAIKMRAKYL